MLVPLATLSLTLLAGCGGTYVSSGMKPATRPTTNVRAKPGAFAWLRPSGTPAGWSLAALPGGGESRLAIPPRWRQISGDAGTVSAARGGSGRVVDGYLNLTPKQGDETLANWPRFRIAHNRDEGDFHVTQLASGSGLRFRGGHGSCVIDDYNTVRTRYREIACLVAGRRHSTVIVAAAKPRTWNARHRELEQAVSSFVPG